jgi:hypothetical protein
MQTAQTALASWITAAQAHGNTSWGTVKSPEAIEYGRGMLVSLQANASASALRTAAGATPVGTTSATPAGTAATAVVPSGILAGLSSNMLLIIVVIVIGGAAWLIFRRKKR